MVFIEFVRNINLSLTVEKERKKTWSAFDIASTTLSAVNVVMYINITFYLLVLPSIPRKRGMFQYEERNRLFNFFDEHHN